MKQVLTYTKNNAAIVLWLVCFIFGMSLYANSAYFVKGNRDNFRYYPPFVKNVNLNDNTLLGAEYFFIAESLASGKGFGNPFKVETGPSAWMPPLYSFFLAGLLLLVKSKLPAACIVIFLKNCTMVATGILAYEYAKKTSRILNPGWIVLFYCILLLANFRWFFQITHDSWLLMLFIGILFVTTIRMWEHPLNMRQSAYWGLFGGISMLTSPILGLTWFFAGAVPSVLVHRRIKQFFLSFTIVVLLFSTWTARNYIVFKTFIPMKSNLHFDLYHTSYNTPDGLIDESFEITHPVWTAKDDPNSLCRTAGELAFTASYKKKFDRAFSENPGRFYRAVKNRFLSAFFIYTPHHQYEKNILLKNIIHVLPHLLLALVLLLRKKLPPGYLTTSIIMYCVYLLPYIMVTYYIRYAIPLTLFKLLFIFWGIDALLQAVGNRATR